MNPFFKQIEAIDPNLVLPFERMLYDAADRCVEGYNGGFWDEIDLGQGVYGLRCPSSDNARVHLVNALNYTDLRTDARSAGTALAILALNALIWSQHAKGNRKNCEALNKLFDKVQNRSRMKPNQLDVPSMIQFLD